MKIKQHNAGITLIETMLALLIFSVGILAAASMQSSSMKSNIRANQASQGSVAATAFIEMMSALPFDHSLLVDKDGVYDPQNPDFGPVAINGSSTRLEWEVEDDFPRSGLKHITVTARWQGPAAQAMTLSYELVRAKDYY